MGRGREGDAVVGDEGEAAEGWEVARAREDGEEGSGEEVGF